MRNGEPRRSVRFSPLLLAVALSPVFLQTSTISCRSGDTTLAELAVLVDGVDIVDGFDPEVRNYSAAVPSGTNEALVHATSTDPNAQVWIDVVVEGERLRYLHGGLGGGDMVVPVPPGFSTIEVWVRAPKGASGFYAISVDVALEFPCSEQGILDAIALGGGPHTFDCNGPTVVTTQAAILIDNDVSLDGGGDLTIDGNDDHGVIVVAPDVMAELIGITVSGGLAFQGGGILNEGTLSISDSVVELNRVNEVPHSAVGGGGIYNSGTLVAMDSEVRDNRSFARQGSGIHNTGTATLIGSVVSGNVGFESPLFSTGMLTLVESTVSDNAASDDEAIHGSGSVTLINSAVVNNDLYAGILFDGTVTVINSTVTSGRYSWPAIWQSNGTLTLISSTVGLFGLNYSQDFGTIRSSEMVVSNSLILGTFDPDRHFSPTCHVTGAVTSLGGNIEGPTNDCGLTDPTDLVNGDLEDLKLGPLTDNGGPTPTYALLPGSVAIDHVPPSMCVDQNGDPLTTDQRGVARPQGGACDVGAFELADCTGTACDDGNDCTADYCGPSDNSWCVNNALPDGTLCAGGACVDGSCVDGPLVSLDDAIFGPDSITLDTNTNLQWLDLTKSTNRSVNDVSGQFGPNGDFAGFRYASAGEVGELFISAGVGYSPHCCSQVDFAAAMDLMSLLGCTDGCFGDTRITVGMCSTLADPANVYRPSLLVYVSSSSALAYLFSNISDFDDAYSSNGNWLVRATPDRGVSPSLLADFDLVPQRER